MARVEFLAVKTDVEKLLEEGHTYASAYDILKEKKKVSLGYSAFRVYINKFLRPCDAVKPPRKKRQDQGDQSPPPPPSVPDAPEETRALRIVDGNKAKTSFADTKNLDVASLFGNKE